PDRLQGLGADQVHKLLLARASLVHIGEKGFADSAFADDGEEPRICGRDLAFQDERSLHLCPSRWGKAKGLTARPDGRREGRGAARDEKEETVCRWLFQRF